MKHHIKKIVLLSILIFATVFSSCEKDLYEEAIKNNNSSVTYQKKFVTINDVTQIVPSLVEYNSAYRYLETNTIPSNKSSEVLNLDLEHILEVIKANGDKSYSIPIIKEQELGENYNFENLHIYKQDSLYKSAIFRYESVDEFSKIDFSSFTGKLEVFDLEKSLILISNYSQGQKLDVKYFTNFGCWDLIVYCDSSIAINIIPGCVGSGSGTATGTNTSGTTTGTNTGNNTSNGTTATIPSETGTVGNTTGTDPTLVDHTVVIVPNEPLWPEFTTQLQMAFLITQRLELDTEKRNWLRNPINLETTAEIYHYLWETLNDGDTTNDGANSDFANELINYIITHPDATQDSINILNLIDDGMIDGQPVVVQPDTPITDMVAYLNCFNTSQSAIVTIYADQPVTGEHDLFSGGNVGHAFVSIQQGTNIKTLGFYPQSGPQSAMPNPITLDPNDFMNVPGIFGNDQEHTFDVSLSIPVNSSQLTLMINGIINVAQNNPLYNLGGLNCTDIAITIFETSIIDIPDCESPRPLWDGQTPGTLGEVIKDMTLPAGAIRNVTGGTAPTNNCN